MDFKEFDFANDIRICIYNLDGKSLPYHRHTNISDITYCAKGKIRVEIPENGVSLGISRGQIIQVPQGKKHRCTNLEPQVCEARYILIQLGEFDIEFFESSGEAATIDNKSAETPSIFDIKLKNKERDLQEALSLFNANAPSLFSAEEVNDIIEALELALSSNTEKLL